MKIWIVMGVDEFNDRVAILCSFETEPQARAHQAMLVKHDQDHAHVEDPKDYEGLTPYQIMSKKSSLYYKARSNNPATESGSYDGYEVIETELIRKAS